MSARKLALTASVLVAIAGAGTAQGQSPDLARALDRALATPGVDPSRTSALAVDLETGEVVYEANSARALAPASAEKLAVSFAALRWRPWFLGVESPPISALSVDDVETRGANGSAAAAAAAFAAALDRRGVAVRGHTVAGRAPAETFPLAP